MATAALLVKSRLDIRYESLCVYKDSGQPKNSTTVYPTDQFMKSTLKANYFSIERPQCLLKN